MADITRWSPLNEMMELQKEMNRLFQRVFKPTAVTEAVWAPSADVFTRGEDVVLKADLPGVKPEDVEISISDNLLTIKGERKVDSEVKRENFYSSEICYGSFERSLTVPEGIRTEDIKATYSNGILEVVLPKAATRVPAKKIPVEIKAA